MNLDVVKIDAFFAIIFPITHNMQTLVTPLQRTV